MYLQAAPSAPDRRSGDPAALADRGPHMLRSLETFQIMRQRIEVLRRTLDDGHVCPGLDPLWIDNPRRKITAGGLKRSGRDVTTASDMGQVGSHPAASAGAPHGVAHDAGA